MGALSREWLGNHPEECRRAATFGDLARGDHIVVSRDATLFDLLVRMQRGRTSASIVASPPSVSTPEDRSRILGIVARGHITEALAEGMTLFGD